MPYLAVQGQRLIVTEGAVNSRDACSENQHDEQQVRADEASDDTDASNGFVQAEEVGGTAVGKEQCQDAGDREVDNGLEKIATTQAGLVAALDLSSALGRSVTETVALR